MLEDAAEKQEIREEKQARRYGVLLFLAFLGHIAVSFPLSSFLSFGVTGGVVVALLVALIRQDFPLKDKLIFWGSFGAVLVSLYEPLGRSLLFEGGRFSDLMIREMVWPQIFVAICASRVLSLRFRGHFIRTLYSLDARIRRGGPKRSLVPAVCLGVAFALMFYIFLGHIALPKTQETPLGVLGASLTGETALHYATLGLFFFILSYLIEWGLDLSESRRLLRGRDKGEGEEAFRLKIFLDPEDPRVRFFWGLEKTTREFVRTLIALLPLLGFLGTIIGLAMTIDSLPHSLVGAAQPTSDSLVKSLSGIALKFQTTLLGLLGSMIATIFFHYLEKREQDFFLQAEFFEKNERQPKKGSRHTAG